MSIEEIARTLNRSKISVGIKSKRLKKQSGEYNDAHREKKYKRNQEFLFLINPKTILDLYAGPKSFYRNKNYYVTSNDNNKNFCHTYNEPAERLIHKLYYEKKKYDLIDLDPFGSAFECFDLSIKMAKKGLIITLGEMGHKRFKRLDYVRIRYGINTLDDFTVNNIVSEIIRIGERNKRKMNVIFLDNYKLISRVYFTFEELKITEQWKNM